jgi:hypothetical protein
MDVLSVGRHLIERASRLADVGLQLDRDTVVRRQEAAEHSGLQCNDVGAPCSEHDLVVCFVPLCAVPVRDRVEKPIFLLHIG